MALENFTQKSIEIINNANNIALKEGNPDLNEIHLCFCLIENEEDIVSVILKNLKINYEAYKEEINNKLNSLSHQSGTNVTIYPNQNYQRILLKSEDESKKMKDSFVSIEHLYLALLDVENQLSETHKKFKITYKDFLKELKNVRKGQRITNENPEDTNNPLAKFGRDMTKDAREGKMDPIIGRDEEINNTVRILSRRKKSNPVLIGNGGVGKTAIIEGIAQRIVNNDVPDTLMGKTLFSLDMSSLVAGAKFKGQFEERLKTVINTIYESNGEIILFIDEIHTIVGAGGGEGAMDASNILKPMLARGEIKVIGATTFKEYREYIEKDAALERRFQKVIVPEPSIEDTVSILRGIKDKYEIYHGLRISDAAVVSAVEMSDRYISDRFLPDKAIDLMDEACATVRTAINTMPPSLDEKKRRIMQLQIEITALRKETDINSQKRLKVLEKELGNLNDVFTDEHNKWLKQKKAINKVKAVKEEISKVNTEIEKAERAYDFEKVSELRYGKLPELNEKLKSLDTSSVGMIKEEVTEDDIAFVISSWTNIPVQKLNESEREKVLNLEKDLNAKVIGQQKAVNVISKAVQRSRAGLSDEGKPIGSFIFMGVSGSGKSLLAKKLAEKLFDSESKMIRFDMSEYMEKHTVSRLIGAAPGYVGYEEGGQLTEAVRHNPYSVLLFDEIEKAHQDVFDIFLQILDDGRLTDNQGRTVDFKNTIIIMTSNIGARFLLEGLSPEGTLNEASKAKAIAALKEKYRPEFLNRIDDIVVFNPLTYSNMFKIIDLEIKQVQKRLARKNIGFKIDDKAKKWILDRTYDPEYGARPIKRYLQSEIETTLSTFILQGKIKERDNLVLTVNQNNKLSFSKEK